MTWLLDVTDPEPLAVAARQIPFPNGVLHQWLPPKPRRSHLYSFFKSDRSVGAATPIRAWDTPSVPIDRGSFEEITGRMPPLSNNMWLTEEEIQLLDALLAADADKADEIAKVFTRGMLRGTRSILQRVMLMQGEAISTGGITLGTEANPENGVQGGRVEFGVEPATTEPIWWNSGSNALDLLDRIYQQSVAYSNRTGDEVRAGVMLTSRSVFNTMLKDGTLRALVASLAGTPLSLGPSQLNDLLQDRELPRIVVDDTTVKNHLGVMVRQRPQNLVTFLPETPENGGVAIGATQWGVTTEAKKLARAQAIDEDLLPGLVVVPLESEDPVQTGTLQAAVVLPVIDQPDLVQNVQVIP